MLAILSTLAQITPDYNYDYSYATNTVPSTAATGVAIGLILFVLAFAFVAYIFFAICLLKIFKKAGRKDTWAAFIPIYNFWVYYEIAGHPGWWALLTLIPIAGGVISLVTMIIASIDLAKAFGKDVGYGILLALLPIIGYPMLAFGDATYHGATASGGSGNLTPQPQEPLAETSQSSPEDISTQLSESGDSPELHQDQ